MLNAIIGIWTDALLLRAGQPLRPGPTPRHDPDQPFEDIAGFRPARQPLPSDGKPAGAAPPASGARSSRRPPAACLAGCQAAER